MQFDRIVPEDFQQLRLKNMQAIEDCLSLEGDQYLEGWKFYQDQAWTGIYTTETGVPEGVGGIQNIKEWYAYNVRYFPGWKTTDMTIFQKDDPNKFYVMCESEGYVDLPDYSKIYYKSRFFHDFEMRDGKIQVHWLHFNSAHFMRELGIEGLPCLTYPE